MQARQSPSAMGRDIQVHIIHLELLQTGIQCSRNIGDILVHFGRDEQLLSRDAGFRNGLTKLSLGTVDFSSIEVIIPQLHGTLGRVYQVTIQIGIGLFEPSGAGAIAELVGVEGLMSVCILTEPA